MLCIIVKLTSATTCNSSCFSSLSAALADIIFCAGGCNIHSGGSGVVHYEKCSFSLLQYWSHVFVFTYLLGLQCVTRAKRCVSRIAEALILVLGPAVCYINEQVSILFALYCVIDMHHRNTLFCSHCCHFYRSRILPYSVVLFFFFLTHANYPNDIEIAFHLFSVLSESFILVFPVEICPLLLLYKACSIV